jgi:hypothetical protein
MKLPTSILTAWILGSCAIGQAQSHSVTWYSLDSGGGNSSGGRFSLSGTLGQLDAGILSGGLFTLAGGFWALTPDTKATNVPTLFISRSAGQILVSWVPALSGYVLQTNSGLTAAGWGDSVTGTTNPATVGANTPALFFRLRK